MNIYVGNLSYTINETELRSIFEVHGKVASTKIITDRDTGRAKGFAFVEMAEDEDGQNAINSLNGTDFSGRTITVNEARPRTPRRDHGGGNRGNSYGGNSSPGNSSPGNSSPGNSNNDSNRGGNHW
jgi:cold-inducible RNA-binding protein